MLAKLRIFVIAVPIRPLASHHLLRATAGGRASGSPQRLVRCRFALADSPVTAMTGLARPPAAPPILPTSKCRSRATAAGSLVAMSVLGPQRTPESICVKRLHTHTQTRPARLLFALRLERLLDVRGNIGRRVVAAEALDDLAVLADEELFEVPGNVGARHRRPKRHRGRVEGAAREDERVVVVAPVALAVALAVVEGDGLGLLHPLEDRQLASAVDLGAREKLALELEAVAGAHVLQSVDELIVALIRLVTELIAGDSEDGDLVAELVDQCVHGSEVTGRGASERRHVLDENDLALVVTETLLAAANEGELEVVCRGHLHRRHAARRAAAKG